MKLLSLLVSLLILLPSIEGDRKDYWDRLLDKYEELCDACLEKKDKKKIQSISEELNEMLKTPEGTMTLQQKERFTSIHNRYRGIISFPEAHFSEIATPRIIEVDTIRRVEHIQVVDTVFIKEIIGSIEMNQFVHKKDTVYHIIQYQNSTTEPKASGPQITEPSVPEAISAKEAAPTVKRHLTPPSLFVMGNICLGVTCSYGATAGLVNKWGGYASYHSSSNSIEPAYSCTSDGISGTSLIMTNGKSEYTRFAATAGVCLKINKYLITYLGGGYGGACVFWQDISDNWIAVADLSPKGAEIEAGAILHYGVLGLSIGVSTTKFQYSELKAGIGVTF